MNPVLAYTLLAIHAGQIYEIDSNLSAEDCAIMMGARSVTYFEARPGEIIYTNHATQFQCITPDLPLRLGHTDPPLPPRPVTPRIHAYPGTWGAPSDAAASLIAGGKARRSKRGKAESHHWVVIVPGETKRATTRGRPSSRD